MNFATCLNVHMKKLRDHNVDSVQFNSKTNMFHDQERKKKLQNVLMGLS